MFIYFFFSLVFFSNVQVLYIYYVCMNVCVCMCEQHLEPSQIRVHLSRSPFPPGPTPSFRFMEEDSQVSCCTWSSQVDFFVIFFFFSSRIKILSYCNTAPFPSLLFFQSLQAPNAWLQKSGSSSSSTTWPALGPSSWKGDRRSIRNAACSGDSLSQDCWP